MRLKTTLYKYPGHDEAGTIEWDSATGELGGSLAAEVAAAAAEARANRYVVLVHPIPSSYRYKVKEPLRNATEFAALLESMLYEVPPELAQYRPRVPGRKMTAEERGRVSSE